MGRATPDPPALSEPLPLMRARLAGGVGPALAAAEPAAGTSHVRAVLGEPRLRRLLAPLDKLTVQPGLTSEEVASAINELATYLQEHRRTLLLVTLHARLLPAAMATTDPDPVRVWLRCCWLAEAAWQATNAPAPIHPSSTASSVAVQAEPFAAGDLVLLRPAAARQRFLLLTEPLRHPPGPAGGWPVDDRYGIVPAGLVEDVFGTGAGHDVIGRCRQARWIWGRYLAEYQDHPLLATATGRQLEAELDTVALRTASGTTPLVLSWQAVLGEATPTVDDWTAVAELTERHLLPRFRIWSVLRLGLHPQGTAPRWLPATAVGVVATAAAGAVTLAASGWFIPAAITGAACYLLLAAGVVVIGQAWAAVWLLRLPAAAALGLAALTTLHPDWWQGSRHWVPAAVALIAASYGYLTVEVRNHGVAPAQALRRALGVTAIGLLHALLITLIGLVVIVPEYAENGAALDRLWDHHGTPYHQWPVATGWAVLLSGTAWCLAAGVFSQILWDDRPITAPLAHLRWRGDR